MGGGIAVVIPSNRPESLARWGQAWEEHLSRRDVRLYVIRDEPNTWDEIRRELGDKSWIIPRRSDCIRSYGFWQAWRDGCEYTITIDDDCYPDPEGGDLIDGHVEALNARAYDSRWFNTLVGDGSLTPRGFPNSGWRRTGISHGGWSLNLDLDAETQLRRPGPHRESCWMGYVPEGRLFPMSGMNLAFRTRLTPWMYFGLQGTRMDMDEGWGFDRFGDIWCGYTAKKLCDLQGWAVHTGWPVVRHEKASDPYVNLAKEAPGREANEWLWEVVAGSKATSYSGIAADFRWLASKRGPYFETLGRAMQTWHSLFEE